jgi:hypothetical protein
VENAGVGFIVPGPRQCIFESADLERLVELISVICKDGMNDLSRYL